MTNRELFAAIRNLGLSIRKQDAEFRINFKDGGEETAYYTNDAADALATAQTFVQFIQH